MEPDLDVASTYAHDRQRFASLTAKEQRVMAEDYRNLAYSPPDKIDPACPTNAIRERKVDRRCFLEGTPTEAREIVIYEPLPREQPTMEPMDTLLGAQHQAQQGGTADWFDSAKQPEEWTPKPIERVIVTGSRLPPRGADMDLIRAAVCPSSFALPVPAPPVPPGPQPPPRKIESDWRGAHTTVIGGDFDGAKGRTT